MSVYVDEPRTYEKEVEGYVGRPRARARWCHMIADTVEELHAMAQTIGLRRLWFQKDHYDLVPTKRQLAIRAGAVPLARTAFADKIRGRARRRRLEVRVDTG